MESKGKNNLVKKKKTVVVGMTGSIDSTVTAYLLGKQEYNIIGVSVVFVDDNEEQQGIYGLCNRHDLEQIQKICQELSMPFYAVKAKDIFKSEIIDNMVSARLQGKKFSNCIMCTKLLLEILYEKAEILGADYVATGHFAKVHYNRDRDEYTLHASSDLKDDQSYLMSSLKEKHLSKLILPLGDMRKEEVIKISNLLSAHFKDTRRKTFCFENNGAVLRLVEEGSSEEFWDKGDILSLDNKDVLGEHHGLYKFYHGQTKFSAEDESSLKNHKVIHMDPNQLKIYVDKEKANFVNYCEITRFEPINDMDISKPRKAYAQWGMTHKKHFCTLYFKACNHVLLKFDKEQEGPIANGCIVSLFNKNSRNAQLIGSGESIDSGIFTHLDRLEGQLDEDTLVEVDEDRRLRNVDEYKF